MKRIAAIFAACLLVFCTNAFALTGVDYPEWSGAPVPENSMGGAIGSEGILLEFDADPEYSNIMDGYIQACFFAFDANEQNYLEMYIMLPEDTRTGDVFSAASGSLSSVTLYEVFKNGEEFYFAGQVAGFAYPDGSSFEIQISSVEHSADSISMRGALNGTLVKFSGTSPTGEVLSLSNVEFDFTMPIGSVSAAPKASAAPTPVPKASAEPFETHSPQAMPSAAPKATMELRPAFTLPPKYAII